LLIFSVVAQKLNGLCRLLSGQGSSEWQTGISILVTSLVHMFIYFRIKSTAVKPPSEVQNTINCWFHVQYSQQAAVNLPYIYYTVFREVELGNFAGWAVGCGVVVVVVVVVVIFSGSAAQRGLWPSRSRGLLITHDTPQ
jgi:hypothetical protein